MKFGSPLGICMQNDVNLDIGQHNFEHWVSLRKPLALLFEVVVLIQIQEWDFWEYTPKIH